MLPSLSSVSAESTNTQNNSVQTEEIKDVEDLTKADVIESENTESTTTYDMGLGHRRTIFHGGDVRYENSTGELIDYDPTLVTLKSDENSMHNNDLSGYEYKTKKGWKTK